MRAAAMKYRSATRQRGLSLIELMVAMVIGSFLILGVTQIFISNQKSYLFQQGQVGNQENGRFALAILTQELTKAGYRSDPSTVFANGSGQNCTFPSGTSVIAVSSTALCIRYQASNRSDVTCQGAALSETSKASITTPYDHTKTNPILVEKIAYDADSKSITCTSGGTTQALVTGVAGLRFEYGAGSGALKTVSTYSTSTNPADVIGAVRFAVLMQSPATASIRDTTAKSPALDEWNTRYGANVADSKQIYQLVQGTVMIRNQMQ
ncbi:MAG: PilW family protein [Pseudomonas sp.]|uniref:PilW family protein n=1 Tax=Pseudomonas sp. TaxID=306 RepID=UPI003D6E46EA